MPPKRTSSKNVHKSDEVKHVPELTVDVIVIETSSKNDSKKLKTTSKRAPSVDKTIKIKVTVDSATCPLAKY